MQRCCIEPCAAQAPPPFPSSGGRGVSAAGLKRIGFFVADPPPQDGATAFSAASIFGRKNAPTFLPPPSNSSRRGGRRIRPYVLGGPFYSLPPLRNGASTFLSKKTHSYFRPFGQLEFFRFLTAPQTAQAHSGHSLFGHRLGEGEVNQIEDLLARAI